MSGEGLVELFINLSNYPIKVKVAVYSLVCTPSLLKPFRGKQGAATTHI
jgi:hypothetical protein